MKAWRWPTIKVETCSLAYYNKKIVVQDAQFVLIHLYTEKHIVMSSVKSVLRSHGNWEVTQLLACHYDLFTRIVRLKKAMNVFFCLKACLEVNVWIECELVGTWFLFTSWYDLYMCVVLFSANWNYKWTNSGVNTIPQTNCHGECVYFQ